MKRRKTILLLALLCLVGLSVFCISQSHNIVFAISDFFRDFGLQTPEDVMRIDGIRYGEEKNQVFDVYYPAGTTGVLPTIISLHGGGYTYGTKETYQFYCMDLAKRGFSVVNFSYRLAPKYPYPSQLMDAFAVLAMVCEHAEEYHIDKENVFFVGDSAGGHLNAQVSLSVSNPEYAALLGVTVPDFTLRATALNCGVYDPEDAFRGSMGRVIKGDLSSYEEELDILGHLTEAFPPAFVMSATGDPCLPYAEPMYEALQKIGVEAELQIYGDEKNKLPHVFHLNVRSADARQCNDEECGFFRRHLEG